jgi:hypothetical protein
MSDEKHERFEQSTKRVFDESVAALDAATRSRLTQARHRALAQLKSPARSWQWSLAPVGVGTLAAAALVVWFTIGQPPPATEDLRGTSLNDLELLLAEEDLEMLDEELDFYGWLEEQPEFVSADDSVG